MGVGVSSAPAAPGAPYAVLPFFNETQHCITRRAPTRTYQKLRRFKQVGRASPARTQRDTGPFLSSMGCQWCQNKAQAEAQHGSRGHLALGSPQASLLAFSLG